MMRTRRTIVATLLLALVAGLVMSNVAMAQSESEAATDEVTLNVGVDSDLQSLNPFNLCCGPDYEYLSLVYDLAFTFDNETLEAAPGLVQEWVPNEDSTEWTMTIPEGGTWHDGQPLTAEDVQFSFSLIADYKMPYYKDYLPFSPTFTVIDDTHVLWSSPEPTFAPNVPAYLPIIPEHIWGQFVVPIPDGATEDEEKEAISETRKAIKTFGNDEAIGSGMFKLEEYQKDQFFHLTLNEDYWGEKPVELTDVVFTVFQSQEAMSQALQGGAIDYAWGLTPGLFNALEGEPNIETRVGDGGCWGNIAWNFGGQGPKASADPTIHDVEFRQAVSHAIDRQAIIDTVYQGTALPGYSILMPGSNGSWVTEIPEELRFDYDPDAANAKLDAAGYTDTDGDGIRNGIEGENLDLELLVITDVLGSVDTGKLIQGYLSDVGIDSFLTTVDQGKAGDLWYTGEWDAYVWDWCPDPDPDFMMSVFTTDQCLGWSDGCYSNPEFDELYKLQQTQLDRAEREATITEMQLMIAEEVPTMVLNYWSDLSAYRTDKFDPSTWVPSPNNEVGLYLFGWANDSYRNLRLLADAPAASTSSSGVPGWVWIAVIGGVVVIAGVVIAARRRGGDEEEA